MRLRAATSADIPAILAIETLPEYRAFVGRWDETRHRVTLAGDDARYFVLEDDAGAVEAHAILRGFAESPATNIELKRIAVRTPGQGTGRKFLEEIIRIVFDAHRAHRLFLDVFESNARARHLYESVGFVYEGKLREAALVDGAYHSLCFMSLLDREYDARKVEGKS